MNINLLIIVIATSTIGSIMRIAEENSESRIKWSKMVAILACAYGIATAAYLLATASYITELLAGIGTLGLSVFAAEIVGTLRRSVGPALANFIKGLPGVFLNIIISNFSKNTQQPNDKKNNELDNQ